VVPDLKTEPHNCSREMNGRIVYAKEQELGSLRKGSSGAETNPGEPKVQDRKSVPAMAYTGQ
jgi:hypothetical protein